MPNHSSFKERREGKNQGINTSFEKFCYKGKKENSRVLQRRGKHFQDGILWHVCKLMGITGRKRRKLTIQEEIITGFKQSWRLAFNRSRNGSFLVTGRRALPGTMQLG